MTLSSIQAVKYMMLKFKGVEFEETAVIQIMALEGLDFEEAVLSYQQRKELPASAFCGPDKSYPAQDAKHVGNGFARLATFGSRLPRSTVSRIHACLLRRAKRFGVEHGGCKWCKKETETQETVAWFIKKHPELQPSK